MGLDIDLYTPKIDISDDNADDIIIEVTGLKSISKFIGLEDTPLYYDNGKFFKVEDNKIVYTDIEWKDISGDIQDAPEIIAVISDLINEVASDIVDERINLHNLNEEAHPYIQNTIQENYNTLDTKIDDTKEELSQDISNLNDALNQEISDRETADNDLSNRIDGLDEDIQEETLARVENDTTLQNNINSVVSDLSDEISARESADTTLSNSISDLSDSLIQEITDRQTADTGLQSQIDAITSASDVTDIVGTYAELQAYDTTSLPDKSIIKVLQDESRNNETTYYRWVITNGTGAWVLIGEEGPYYTKSEADGRFVNKTTTVNNKALSSNITLTASDVGALPDNTVIGDGTLTIQKNGVNIGTFNANATANKSINITVPTVNNGTLDIQVNGTSVGTFTANQSGNTTANIIVPNSVTWGNIQGTLSDQTDLQNTLDLMNEQIVANHEEIGEIGQTIGTYGDIVTYNANNFATSSQGLLANTALQPNDNISELVNNVGYITSSALSGYATENFVTSQGYITGITSNDVTTALGYTPYNSTNPNGYITSSALTNYVTTNTTQTITGNKVINGASLTTNDVIVLDGSNSRIVGTVSNNTRGIIRLTSGNEVEIGDTSSTVNIKGSATRPTYNGADLALLSDAGGSAPSNMVTTDTQQTISGNKTFSGRLRKSFGMDEIEIGTTAGYKSIIFFSGSGNIPWHITGNGYTGATLTIDGFYTTTLQAGNNSDSYLILAEDSLVFHKSDNTIVDLLSGGGTVDQTYDGTSTNAQSGVAIEGELTNYQKKLTAGDNIEIIDIEVPSGYTQLEYIESDGTGNRYLNSGIVPNTFDYEITTIAKFNNAPTGINVYAMWGYKDPMVYGYRWDLSVYQQKFNFGVNEENTINAFDTNKHTFISKIYEDNGQYLYSSQIDNIVYTQDATINNPTNITNNTIPIFLFARANERSTPSGYVDGRIYRHTVKKAGTIIQDLVPAKRNSDNAIGMYDLIADTFLTFTRKPFIAGANAPIINFVNNSGYITNSVNNLTNYYTKTEIDNTIGDIETALHNINSGGN